VITIRVDKVMSKTTDPWTNRKRIAREKAFGIEPVGTRQARIGLNEQSGEANC